MRKLLAFVAGLGLLATACSDSGSGGDPLAGPTTTERRSTRTDETTEVRFVTALRQIGDCDALLTHLRVEALERVGPYGLGGGWGVMPTDGGFAIPAQAESAPARNAAGSAEDSGSSATGAGGDGSYSATNTQEQGVDEPDIVKTDGERIITLSNGVLSIVDTTTDPPVRTGSIKLATDNLYPNDFLIEGDRVLVFGQGWHTTEVDESTGADATRSIWAPGRQLATITEISLADPSNPTAGATLRVDGGYLTSRLVDGTARVVLRSEPNQLPFVYPQNEAGEDRAEQANREVIEQSSIEDWMPSYELRAADGSVTDQGLLASCQRVEAPTEFAGFGTLSVLTFAMAAPLGAGDATSVLAAGDTAYASATGLYVATTSYLDPRILEEGGDAVERWNTNYSTSIHAFDITGADPAEYTASGTVPGHLINQFAMSEHDGKLRVATTKGMPWNATEESESLVTVLERSGTELVQTGQVGDMGRGERIYSVRYAGDIAYVVTFRQTDPFYTVDLSDPAAPKVVGELKIPGFSSYLHPIDDNLVIGIGQHATDEGRVQGTKVSLFDVSNLAAPTEIANWTLPNSHSNAEYDHHAFLYWPATKQLVVPLNQWPESGNFEDGFYGAVVLHVDRAGITETGRIAHPMYTPTAEEWCGPLPSEPTPRGSSYPAPECKPQPQPDAIQRSLVVGDDLWTLGQWTLLQSALGDLSAGAHVQVD